MIVKKETDRLEIVVKDNGIGIPEDMKEKIFDEFHQVEGSATRRFEGTGLGLAMVKAMLKLMNGSINIESELAKGTQVTVSIPEQNQVDLTEAAPRSNQQTSIHPPMENTMQALQELNEEAESKILVVDDNPVNCELICEILGRERYQILTTTSGRSFWGESCGWCGR